MKNNRIDVIYDSLEEAKTKEIILRDGINYSAIRIERNAEFKFEVAYECSLVIDKYYEDWDDCKKIIRRIIIHIN